MESLRQLYKIGNGPSSSHTMGPRKAAQMFLEEMPEGAERIEVTLYGSLAATGKGHLTDKAVLEIITPVAPAAIIWKPETVLPFHTNGIRFEAFNTDGKSIAAQTYYSIGGGDIVREGESRQPADSIYSMTKIKDILEWCERTGLSYWEYVGQTEGPEIWEYLRKVWRCDESRGGTWHRGGGCASGRSRSTTQGRELPVSDAAGYSSSLKSRGLVYAYALAVSEENAAGGEIVTAPTCGSCGIVPAVLYHLHTSKGFSEDRILRALATAGLFGNVVKFNASVSGAEVGCQGEVGVACAMAAAAASQLFGGTPAQIEYSAEMGLEHHLGLPCDPVCGLVQIPCIERNAYAAARALDANLYAAFSDGHHRVDFDRIVEVMKQTGHDLPSLYKETSQGGLAVI